MVEGISAAILAGGSGRRVNGMIKPKIVIDGEMIISRIISVIRDIFDEIIIVTNTPSEFEEFSFCKIVGDEIVNSGPLGGIHAALKASSNKAVFIMGGDMPFPDRRVIMKVTKAYDNKICDALIPRIDDYMEPLFSVYSVTLVKSIEDHLARNSRIAVVDFVRTINVIYLQLKTTTINKRTFTNINSLEDIIDAGERPNQKSSSSRDPRKS
jgi:molybdopterin-guanine dinucleotide biosynthesis protein A